MTVRKHGVSVETWKLNTLDGDIYAVINQAFNTWFTNLDCEGYSYEIIKYELSSDLGKPDTHTWIELEVYLTPHEVDLPEYDKEELVDFGLRAFESDLLQQAKSTLEMNNKHLDEFLANCKKTKVDPMLARRSNGSYILLDFLMVKSNCLNTITRLTEKKDD